MEEDDATPVPSASQAKRERIEKELKASHEKAKEMLAAGIAAPASKVALEPDHKKQRS